MKKYAVDTNCIIDEPEILLQYNCVVLSHTLREIEKHEHSANKELAYNARRAKRFLNSHDNIEYDLNDYVFDLSERFDNYYEDNKMLKACVVNDYGIITNDILLKMKAEGYGIEVIVPSEKEEDSYCGYKEYILNEEELAYFYENIDKNTYNLLVNEYLIIYDNDDNEVDCLKWNGEKHIQCIEKNLNTMSLGKFKPLDLQQIAAVDSLITNDITLLRGKAGSGKSLIALTYAMHQLEKGKISRLIILVNPVPVHGAQELGFYKGTMMEKLMQSGIGNILTSKFGDKNEVEALITTGKIVMIPFVDIRGYDTGSNSLVWITEAQNLNIPLMKLGLQRIAKGSKIIIDGDDKAQVDKDIFGGNNNGIKRMSELFRGKDLYGEVEFSNIYRSEIAEIADEM